MENNLIGTQIMKFRKAAGLTQEELGRSVGVSTQAVSRWECGGAPDVTLLPAIADRLGVTIDALFGREGGEKVDIHDTVRKWVRSLPEEQVLDQMNRLVWTAACQVPFGPGMQDTIPYLDSCLYQTAKDVPPSVACSKIMTDDGVLFGVYANDYSYTTLCPRPKAGYTPYFPELETMRTFCALLAQPGCMETILFFMQQKSYYFSAEAVAEGAGLDSKTAKTILEQMTKLHLLYDMEIGLAGGMETVYSIQDDPAFVPLFYLINCMTQKEHFDYVNYSTREKPLL